MRYGMLCRLSIQESPHQHLAPYLWGGEHWCNVNKAWRSPSWWYCTNADPALAVMLRYTRASIRETWTKGIQER